MPSSKFVVKFLFAFVLSAGMLFAQADVASASGQIPTYVYSTEVSPSVQTGEYDLTVTAIFSPRTGVKKVELTLEKYTANPYYGQWIAWQYRMPATFGENPGFPYSTGRKVITPADAGGATYSNLRPGVYSVNDGVTRSVVTIGTPSVDQMPDFSDTSQLLKHYNVGGQIILETDNRHPSYMMAWQGLGTMDALGFDALLTTPIGVFAVGPTSTLQSQLLNVVVCDVVMNTCSTTQVPVRNPFAGRKK